MVAVMHSGVGRSDDTRSFRLADVCEPEFLPSVGPDGILPEDPMACFKFSLVLMGGKTNKVRFAVGPWFPHNACASQHTSAESTMLYICCHPALHSVEAAYL
jgi:hypothetical protein